MRMKNITLDETIQILQDNKNQLIHVTITFKDDEQ